MPDGPITTLALELADLDTPLGRKLRSVLKLPLGIGDMVLGQLRSIDETPPSDLADQLDLASQLTERLAGALRTGNPITRDTLTACLIGLPVLDTDDHDEPTTETA